MVTETKLEYNTRDYHDIQGLKKLQADYHKNSAGVKKEVAHQFEAILMQMVMRSMRDANKAFSSELFGSDQMSFYQDMFDNQLTLTMSNSDDSFTQAIERTIDQYEPPPDAATLKKEPEADTLEPLALRPIHPDVDNVSVATDATAVAHATHTPAEAAPLFKSPEDFVKKIWSSARVAASLLGTSPEILVAQAALETNWGKNIISNLNTPSSNNLFNIKADSSWKNKFSTVDTLEEKNGVLVKEKSHFRNYDSVDESLMDYVSFLKDNDRYKQALSNASEPDKFMNGLQNAGYATDQNYASKVLQIFKSQHFQHLIAKVR